MTSKSGDDGPRIAAVALGANLGDRERALESALVSLAATPGIRLVARSRWHETAPESGRADEPLYLNGAALLETTLAPRELLERMLAIVAEHGRVRRRGRSTSTSCSMAINGSRSRA